jgi:putative nucleotidyltransferase with HDIG domain
MDAANRSRILFVDDEPQILEGLRHRLRRFRSRWDLVFATGAADALGQLAASTFDVVVSDLRMPGIDGATLLRHVRDRFPGVVRIVLSGESDVQLARCASLVAHQFIAKPCDPDVLEGILDRTLALRALVNDEPIRRLVTRLDDLPALPETYTRVKALVADDRSTAADVADVIKRDAAIAAKVLQLVNSAFFGLSHAVGSVEDAVVRLGLDRTGAVVLASEVFGVFSPGGTAHAATEKLQRHSLATAHLADRISLRPLAEDVYTAALLHDVGKLVLALHAPDHLRLAEEEAVRAAVPGYVAEQALFGFTHAEVGAYLLGLWGLPHFIVEAVANHHLPGRVPGSGLGALAAVHVADTLEHARTGERFKPPEAPFLAALGATDAEWTRWVADGYAGKEGGR